MVLSLQSSMKLSHIQRKYCNQEKHQFNCVTAILRLVGKTKFFETRSDSVTYASLKVELLLPHPD